MLIQKSVLITFLMIIVAKNHLIVILLVSYVRVIESLDTKKVFILVYSQLSSELIKVKVCCYFLSNISCCSAQDDTNVLV